MGARGGAENAERGCIYTYIHMRGTFLCGKGFGVLLAGKRCGGPRRSCTVVGFDFGVSDFDAG